MVENKKETEFKVGDKVKIISNTNFSNNEVGDIGIITEVRDIGEGYYRVHVAGKEDEGNNHYGRDLELITDECYIDSLKKEIADKQRELAKLLNEIKETEELEFEDFLWGGWDNSLAVKLKTNEPMDFLYVIKKGKDLGEAITEGYDFFLMVKENIPKGYKLDIRDDNSYLRLSLVKE